MSSTSARTGRNASRIVPVFVKKENGSATSSYPDKRRKTDEDGPMQVTLGLKIQQRHMKRLIVGIVSANRPDHEGKIVRYIQDSIGEETFYVGELNLVEKETGDRGVMLNADNMIEPDEINFRESWDRLKPKVTAMNKKLIALAHAEEGGELSKHELELIDQDPRFLPAAFAACYSAGLVTSSFLRDSGELELVPPFHIGNRGQAKALLARFIRAFPEAEGYLNPLSIARAAGYYLRFQDVLQPKIVNTDREDLTCYDVYILKACEWFWEPPKGTEEGSPRPWIRPYYRLNQFAKTYSQGERPEWLKQKRLKKHPPILQSPRQIEYLATLSLVFSWIPESRADPFNTHGHITSTVEDAQEKREDEEMAMFLRDTVVPDQWQSVLSRYYDESNFPLFPTPGIPDFPQGSLNKIAIDNTITYYRYVSRMGRFSRSAIAQVLLTQLKVNVCNSDNFNSVQKAIRECAENKEFSISTAEDGDDKRTRVAALEARRQGNGNNGASS